FRDGGQSVSIGCRAGTGHVAQDGGGRVVGGGVAGFDAVAGPIVLGRLSGWHAGADDVGPTVFIHAGAGQDDGALDGVRIAAGADGSGVGFAVRYVSAGAWCVNRWPAVGNADTQYGGCDRRGIDAGITRWRCAVVIAGVAAPIAPTIL